MRRSSATRRTDGNESNEENEEEKNSAEMDGKMKNTRQTLTHSLIKSYHNNTTISNDTKSNKQ